MRHLTTTLLLALTTFGSLFAEEQNEQKILKLDIDVRADFQYDAIEDHTIDSETGFRGKYLVIRADGEIIPGLTYSWRQRLNKMHSDQGFFDATDWVYLNYQTGKWNFQAGKEVVAIGGYEYDRAPINLYGCSVFWNNVPCYDLGVSVGYDVTKSDRITLQTVQSPFFTPENRNMYAYNVMWTGNHGIFSSIWSANMIEYAKGRFINYIALGNRFDVGKWSLELDLMNRAASHQTFLFKDCSVMGELSYTPTSRWKVFGKVTYDVNHSGTGADFTVANGTELTMAGMGAEFYPLRKNRHTLRVHAAAFYSWGKNTIASNLMQDNTTFLSVGLTWNMNLLNISKK